VKHQVLVFGLVFIVAGLAFKLGAAPFHMWIPDVYQGAPTSVTIMIGSAPELAAFAIAIRLLVEGLLPLALDWQQMLMIMAIGSLMIGKSRGHRTDQPQAHAGLFDLSARWALCCWACCRGS
jgi:NADH-quinone oxidoreductase subunit N